MSNTQDRQDRRLGEIKTRIMKTHETYSELVFAISYFLGTAALAWLLGGPPLYASALAFRWAICSSLTWTIVPEVLDGSLQPISGKCEPMKRMRRRMRPLGKYAFLMSSAQSAR